MADVYGRSPTVKSTSSYPKKSSSSSSSSNDDIKSGDAKLAAFRESHSSEPSAPKIITRTEEERKANTLITSDVERANDIDRTKEALQKLNNEKARAEFEANGGRIPAIPSFVPQTEPDPDPTPFLKPDNNDWKNHINPDNSLFGSIKNKTFMKNISEGIESQVESGKDKVKENEVHVSGFSQKLMEFGTKVEEKADAYKQYAKTVNPTNPMMGEIVPSAIKSGSGLISMFSKAPAGAEIATQAPEALPNALAVAGLGMVDYTYNTAKNDPVQLATDAAVFSAFGAGLGKLGSGIKSNVPTISTGEQGFLLKIKVPETPTAPKPIVEPTTVAEYKGTVLGKDLYKFKDVNTEMVIPETSPNGIPALIGETRNGMTDVYFKLNENQAKAISEQFTGSLENIKTSEGSFISFEPTGKIISETFAKSESPRIGTTEPKLIGTEIQSSSGFKNPIRFEKRTNLVDGELSVMERSQLRLAEATQTIESTIVDTPKQLDSGLVKVQKNLFKDEAAEVRPSTTYVQKEQFVGEMPRMNIKVAEPIRANAPALKFKEKSVLDQQFKDFFEKATSKNKDPLSNSVNEFKVKRTTRPEGGSTPMFYGVPISNPLSKHGEDVVPDFTIKSITGTKSITYPETETKTSPKPKPVNNITFTTESKSSTGAGFPLRISKAPKLENPIKQKSKKKQSKKQDKDAWEYKRTTNKYKSPLDVQVKGGIL